MNGNSGILKDILMPSKLQKKKFWLCLKISKDAMGKIDENMVNEWARDLVIVQTFIGLQFQEAILKKGAEIKGVG